MSDWKTVGELCTVHCCSGTPSNTYQERTCQGEACPAVLTLRQVTCEKAGCPSYCAAGEYQIFLWFLLRRPQCKTRFSSKTNYDKFNIRFASATLWNSLDENLRKKEKKENFKSKLFDPRTTKIFTVTN